MFARFRQIAAVTFLTAVAAAAAQAQEAGNVFDLFVQDAPHLEPYIPRPAQEEEARGTLAGLETVQGRKPNILIFLVDDMGWGDIGVFGGGIAVGAPTPEMDRLAREGLKLTSTHSDTTCAPIRAAILMVLLALGLAAFGWWQLAGVPLVEDEGHEHIERDD